ncbi:MAG TPA: hypothetical protein VF950_22570 [Planctomycetota bacterium]
MILGLAGMLVANAAVLACAREAVRRWGTRQGHLDVLLFFVARFLLISLVVIAAGTTGTFNGFWLSAAGVVALAILRPRVSKPRVPFWGYIWTCAAAIVLLRLLLQVWFFAPHNHDALSYHLTKIPEWIRAGGFTREMGVDTHATFPAGFELIEAWWVVFLRHDVLIELAGVEFLLLASAACFALARELGMSEKASAWAALLYALTPGLQVSATSCLNDVPIAALVLSTFALLLAKAPWPWVAAIALLGVGIKPTYGYALPGFLVLVAKSAGTGLPVGVVALVPGLFWYARNALWFGNPMHPVGSRGLIGGEGTLKIQFGPSLSSGWRNIRALFNVRVYDDQVGYGALLSHISGWGAVAFACGSLALWGWVRETPRAGRVLLGMSVSLVSVLFLVNHDDWCLRFVLFFPSVLAVAAVWAAERMRPVLGLVTAGAAFQFAATFFPVDHRLENAIRLAKMSWRERSVGSILESQPPGVEPVLFHIVEAVHSRGESYLIYRPDYTRPVFYFRGRTIEDLRKSIEETGARYVYCSKVNPRSDPLIEDAVGRELLERCGERLFGVKR